jgi:tetratricopeptide (TPR) repeat protein
MVWLQLSEVRSHPLRRFALSPWFAPALVALVAVAAHSRSMLFGFTDADDRDLILDDQAFLAQPSSLWRVFGRAYMHVVDTGHEYYRPVVSASYVLDAQWSGTDPRGYHVTNVVLYAAVSALVYAFLRTLALGRGPTLAAALLFAVHPALVPAVAWIPGRNDAWLALFSLAAWIAFVRDAASPSPGRKAAHALFFALSLFTKESAVVLPVACVAHVALAQPDDWARLRRSLALGGFVLTWVAIVAARVVARPPTLAWKLSPGDVAANLPLLVGALGKIVLPVHLSVLAEARDVPLWPGVLAALAIGLATVRVAGVRVRVVALGGAVLVLFLAPVVVLPGSLVLGHRLVLPACGALLAVAEIARAARLERDVFIASASAVAAALAVLTIAFEGAFRDPMTFARDAVDGSAHSPFAHLCLGRAYQERGQDDQALSEYRTALALGPAEVAHNNIAVIAMSRGHWQEAEAELAEEIAINPRYGKAHYNLGIVLRHEGRVAEACSAEARAVEEAPEDPASHRELERDCARARSVNVVP